MGRKICRYLLTGGVYATHVMFCCHAQTQKLMSFEELQEKKKDYINDISLLHHDVQKKRETMIQKFNNNEIPECINCSSYIPVSSTDTRISFINAALTLRCQLSCIFCGEYFRDGGGDTEILHIMKNYLLWLVKNNLVSEDADVLWTGGEPTLIPNFGELLQKFSFLKKPQLILTNCVSFSDTIADLLQKKKVNLLVSIDSGSQNTYSIVKGQNLFNRVTENIIRYREYEKNNNSGISLKYIIAPGYNDSIDEFEKFYKFCTNNQLKMELSFDYNIETTAEMFSFVENIVTNYPEVGIEQVILFSRFTDDQKNKLIRTRIENMGNDTKKLHSCFVCNVYNLETDGTNLFFWTAKNATFRAPQYEGMTFFVRSASEKKQEVKVTHSTGKIEYFRITSEWNKAAIEFDSQNDVITLDFPESIHIDNDDRELGCCIQKVAFTNSIEKILESAALNLAPWLAVEESNKIGRMTIDASEITYYDEWRLKSDYARLRTFELLLLKIKQEKIAGDLAEVGVFVGVTASLMNRILSDRAIYLYDTFSGFDQRDIDIDIKNEYCSKQILEHLDNCDASKLVDCPENFVLENLSNPEVAVIRKGYFPETIGEESEHKFAFVSVDCDLYKPILASLNFFYPRLAPGGYIIIHDYFSETLFGAKQAVKEFEQHLNEQGIKLAKFYVTDLYGSLVITKE